MENRVTHTTLHCSTRRQQQQQRPIDKLFFRNNSSLTARIFSSLIIGHGICHSSPSSIIFISPQFQHKLSTFFLLPLAVGVFWLLLLLPSPTVGNRYYRFFKFTHPSWPTTELKKKWAMDDPMKIPSYTEAFQTFRTRAIPPQIHTQRTVHRDRGRLRLVLATNVHQIVPEKTSKFSRSFAWANKKLPSSMYTNIPIQFSEEPSRVCCSQRKFWRFDYFRRRRRLAGWLLTHTDVHHCCCVWWKSR